MPTSGHPDQSDHIESMKNDQKSLKNANLLSKMALVTLIQNMYPNAKALYFEKENV